jgi:peptide/nickel transport system permease protein
MTATLTPVPAGRAPIDRFRWIPAALRKRNVELYVGGGIFLTVVLLCVAAPLLTAFDPNHQDLHNVLQGSSATHLLGTDNLGRDVWSRLLYGGRTNLYVAVVAVLIPMAIGTVLGALTGYFGGLFDTIVMRIADIVSAFPFFVLVIALVFVLGNGEVSIFIAISIVSWVSYTRIVRAESMILKDRDFIDACKTGGLGSGRIILRHVLPNTATQAVVYAMSDIVLNINVIVTLSFFGLGIVPPTPDWGQMMSDGQQFLLSGHESLVLIPGLAVIVTSLGLSFLGDGLANILRAKQ